MSLKTAVALGTTKVPASTATLVTVKPLFRGGPANVVEPSPKICTLASFDAVAAPELGGIPVEVCGMNWVIDVIIAGLVLIAPVIEHAIDAGSTKPALRAHVTRSSPCEDR